MDEIIRAMCARKQKIRWRSLLAIEWNRSLDPCPISRTQQVTFSFEGLIRRTQFITRIGELLGLLQTRLGMPVDIEFAYDGTDFCLLQCRPQSYGADMVPVAIPQNLALDKLIFFARQFVSNGKVPHITHIVYVDLGGYSQLPDPAYRCGSPAHFTRQGSRYSRYRPPEQEPWGQRDTLSSRSDERWGNFAIEDFQALHVKHAIENGGRNRVRHLNSPSARVLHLRGRLAIPESTRLIVFPLIRPVRLKAATASSRAATLPMFVRRRPFRTRWTSSLNWARSGTTTKSIVRPPEGRVSVGPVTVISVPPARITPAERFAMSPPMGLRIYKELVPMKKEQLDLTNAMVWIPDSKTPNGVAEVPLTPLALEAFRDQMRLSPCSPYLFPSDQNPSGHIKTLKTSWEAALRRAKVSYFRLYDLRSTYATRLSAGGVADEWVTQMLRQGDAQVFKKYSQMKLQMKREALEKLNRHANEMPAQKAGELAKAGAHSGTVTVQ
jgi:hypothetical protein